MENLIVAGPSGRALAAPDGTAVGRRDPVPIPARMVWASMSARYHPSHPGGESCLFGMDFSFVIPKGSEIVSASLAVFTNTFAPALAPEWVVGPVQIDGLVVFARLTGGNEGQDYQIRWVAVDSDNNVWPRTALVLSTLTS